MKCDIVNHMAEAWHSGKTVGRGKKGTRERPWAEERRALGRDRGKENI